MLAVLVEQQWTGMIVLLIGWNDGYCIQVACRPSLAPLTVNSIPANLAPHARISEALDPQEWEVIETAAYQKAGFK